MPLSAAYCRLQECGEGYVGAYRIHGAVQQCMRFLVLGDMQTTQRILDHWKEWKMLLEIAGGGNHYRARRWVINVEDVL